MRKSRKQQQRLLRNMSAHAVVLELLQIPYEKVRPDPGRAGARVPEPYEKVCPVPGRAGARCPQVLLPLWMLVVKKQSWDADCDYKAV